MSVKTAGVGHFQIPTAPAAGTSVTSGAANVYTTTPVQLIASTAAALYITGLYVEEAAVSAGTYVSVQLMVGAAAAETIIGQYLVAPSTGSTVTRSYRPINPPIPVAAAARLSVKTADSVGAVARLVSLEVIAQTNVVDDGLTAPAVWQDATAGDFTVASSIGKALYIANVAPGAAGGHLISGANAGTTTFGALTVTGATTLTGNVALADGLTIAAPSTGNRAGLSITGNGTGAGAIITGGATGIGFNLVGGGTSGDGIKVTTTSGHGINLAPVGTNMHGLLSTGGNGGTSDGIKAAAGTGGVDLRAAITGNITGNLSGSVGSVTGAVGSVTGAVGSVTAAVTTGTISNNAITAAAIAADAITAAKIADGAIDAATFAAGAINAAAIAADAITDAKVAADVTIASVTGAVGSVTGAVGSVTGNVGGSVASVTAAVTVTGDLSAAMKASVTAAVPTAAQIRAEMDANSTDLDSIGVLATSILARTDVATSSRAAPGDAMGLTAATIDLIWDEVIESGLTGRQLQRLFASALLGKVSGMGTLSPVFRDVGDTKARITATVDADGNRTAVALDGT